uniref:PARG helical domain-containing protein n=1 Tax=Arion vulgaris TaxID=1028688 RepID=A0A0B7B4Y4_9EUPU
MGVPFGHLKRAPECLKENMSSNEKVDSPDEKIPPIPPPYVRLGEIAKPTGNDHSTDNYVSMPHLADAKNSERNYSSYRWERIKSVLQYETPHNSLALEKVIKSYGSHHWKFDILHQYFEIMDPQIANTFFEETLPKIQELALKLPELFTEPLNILKQKRNMEIHLTQQQVACLLANAFFCTFPESNPKSKGGQVSGINFNTLYGDPRSSHRKIESFVALSITSSE